MPLLNKLLKKCSDVKKLEGFGRRHVGYFATLPSGVKVYIFIRKHMQMYRGKEFTPSQAMEKDLATWMIDKEILRQVVKKGVQKIIVFVKDTGDFYTSSIDLWLDPKVSKDIPLARHGDCRHLGIHLMSKLTVQTKLTLQRL